MNNKGAVLVISAAALMAITIAVLAIDVGIFWENQKELQTAADAAALAAIVNPLSHADARNHANLTAKQYFFGNTVALSENQPGTYDWANETFIPSEEGKVLAHRVKAYVPGGFPTFFAKIFGVHSVAIETKAVAVRDPRVTVIEPRAYAANGIDSNDYYYVIPFGIAKSVVDPDGDKKYNVGLSFNIYPNGTTQPDQFVFLNLDGGPMTGEELEEFFKKGPPFQTRIPIPPYFMALEADSCWREINGVYTPFAPPDPKIATNTNCDALYPNSQRPEYGPWEDFAIAAGDKKCQAEGGLGCSDMFTGGNITVIAMVFEDKSLAPAGQGYVNVIDFIAMKMTYLNLMSSPTVDGRLITLEVTQLDKSSANFKVDPKADPERNHTLFKLRLAEDKKPA